MGPLIAGVFIVNTIYGLLFGMPLTTVDAPVPSVSGSCAPGERSFDKPDGSGTFCGTLVRAHLKPSDTSSVTPQPPAPAELPPTTPPAYNASHYSNTTGAVQGASAATAAALLETINIRLTDTAYSAYPWYGKIQAVKLLKTDGSESNGSESSLYIQYKVTSDFKLGNCYKYTANALISWLGASKGDPAYAPAYNSNCYQFSNYEQVDKRDGLLNSNAYYVTKSHQLPYSVSQQSPVCSAGYTYDYSKSACSLTTPSAAPPGPDGVCDVVRTSPTTFSRSNPFDPDCARVTSSGDLSISSDASTVTVTSSAGPSSPSSVSATLKAKSDSSTTLETTTTNKVSGESQTTSREVDPSNRVSAETFGAPTYNGSPLSPVMTYPAAGTACGAPGQPACKVELVGGSGSGSGGSSPIESSTIRDGVKDALKSDADTSLFDDLDSAVTSAKTPYSSDTFFSSITQFNTFSPAYSAPVCSVALDTSNLSATFFNQDFSLNLADVCPLVTPYEDTIRTTALAIWAIFAMLYFIRLTV